jgi:hypothetical protein
MAEDKIIVPKSGYVPKQKNMIGLVNNASNFGKETKEYLVKELNKNITNYENKGKKPGILKKVYNNLFNKNKNKNYGQNDLLQGSKDYYPPKP